MTSIISQLTADHQATFINAEKCILKFKPLEKEFLQKMLLTIGDNGISSLSLVCDLYIYDRTLKIDALIKNLSPLCSGSRQQINEAADILRKFKVWSAEHKSEILSEIYLCKIALHKIYAPKNLLHIYQPPFFYDSDIIKNRGLSRFQKYNKEIDFSFYLQHQSETIKQKFLSLIGDLSQVHLIYYRAAISGENTMFLSEYTYKVTENNRLENTAVTSDQILNSIKYIFDVSLNATKQGHLLLDISFIQDFQKSLQTAAIMDKQYWSQVEEDLYLFISCCAKQCSIYKDMLKQALDDTLSADQFYSANNLQAGSDMTHDLFCSMLNQNQIHFSHLASLTIDLILKMQSFFISEFGNKTVNARYEFSLNAHKELLICIKHFVSLINNYCLLQVEEQVMQFFTPAHLSELSSISAVFENLTKEKDIITFNDFYIEYLNFLSKINLDSISCADALYLKLYQKQLTWMVHKYHAKINQFSSLLIDLSKHFKTIELSIEEKRRLVLYLSFLQATLTSMPETLTWIFQSTALLFEDLIFENNHIWNFYTSKASDIDWENELKIKQAVLQEIPVQQERLITPLKHIHAQIHKPIPITIKVAQEHEQPDLPRRNVSSVEALKILHESGFTLKRQTGSHAFLKNDIDQKTVTIPVGYRTLDAGTLHNIWKQAGFL